MGQSQSASVTVPGRRKSLRNSLRSPFPRRSRTTNSLSATFNYLEPDVKGDHQLNLNTATAEELMTLPGVTRAVAQNIVEYRQAIGRYHKVEDLALVTGVGAERLNIIRPEICVHRQRNNSTQSSRAQSLDSLVSSEGSPQPPALININAANVFTLMSLRGLTQELAANIVDHRERRGPFNTVNDLLKVRGISGILVNNIRNQVIVGPPPNLPHTPMPINKKLNAAILNGTSFTKFTGNKPQVNGFKDILEVLCAFSQRPYVDEVFSGQREGRPALRVSSWNLSALTCDKAGNPGVREVICRTLLENRFSLVATQEVMESAAAEKIVGELNAPRLRQVLEWKGHRGRWNTCTALSADGQRSCGFLYDSQSHLCLQDMKVVHDNENALAVLAHVQVETAEVSVMNISLSTGNSNCARDLCCRLLDHLHPDIVLGDFSTFPEAEFIEEGYTRVLLSPNVTNSMAPSNSGATFSDNIFLSKRHLSRYTGMSGIVRQGLNHVAIPRGWTWGGPASEHCPVWCELYT